MSDFDPWTDNSELEPEPSTLEPETFESDNHEASEPDAKTKAETWSTEPEPIDPFNDETEPVTEP